MKLFRRSNTQDKSISKSDDKEGNQSDTNAQLSEKHFKLALLHSKKSDSNAALEECNRAIELNPENAQAYKLRGTIYGMLGDNDNLIADYKIYLKLNPQDHAIKNAMEKITGKGSVNVEELISAGIQDLETGNLNEALEKFTEAIEQDPDSSKAYRCRGLTYAGMGDAEKAERDLLKAKELSPYDGELEEDIEKVRQLKQLTAMRDKLK